MGHTGSTKINRRKFIESSGAAVVGSSVALSFGSPRYSYASSTAKILKVGLIGCGGRGTGAAAQALQADPDVILTAMGDVFLRSPGGILQHRMREEVPKKK